MNQPDPGSYYDDVVRAEYLDVIEFEEPEYIRCTRCRGSGLVLVHDQETDCLACEGDGEIPI